MDKYYTNLIKDYLTNYDSAISKVDKETEAKLGAYGKQLGGLI